jgi:hypothetical protein
VDELRGGLTRGRRWATDHQLDGASTEFAVGTVTDRLAAISSINGFALYDTKSHIYSYLRLSASAPNSTIN